MPENNILERVINSKEFLKNLQFAKATNDETSLETGLTVSRKFMKALLSKETGEFEVGGVQISESDEQIILRGHGFGFANGHYDFLELHFHGKFESSYIPSEGDVISLNQKRSMLWQMVGVISSPVQIMASYDKQKRTYLFMLQELTKKRIPDVVVEEFTENYERDIHSPFDIDFINPDKVTDYFRKSGMYNCEIVCVNSRGIYKKDAEKLKNFSEDIYVDKKQLASKIAECEEYARENKDELGASNLKHGREHLDEFLIGCKQL